MAQLLGSPLFTALDANGRPISGAKAYFYQQGTTVPLSVYQDPGLSLVHTNPVIADSAGRFPDIYFDEAVATRCKIFDANDVLIDDIDRINGSGSISQAANATFYLSDYLTATQLANALAGGGTSVNINTAMDACIALSVTYKGGTIILPPGVFEVTKSFDLTYPVMIEGAGNSFTPYIMTTGQGTKIVYTKASSFSHMFKLSGLNFGGWGFKRLWLECNDKATEGIRFESVQGGVLEQITITGFTSKGLVLRGISWTTFRNYAVNSYNATMVAAVHLTGEASLGNACFNTFINSTLGHRKNAYGILVGFSDNNTFLQTYIASDAVSQADGTGYGVWVDGTEEANFPTANTFFDISAGYLGWGQSATNPIACTVIWGYKNDNGQRMPITNGSRLVYENYGSRVDTFAGGSIGKSIGFTLSGTFTATNTLAAQVVAFPVTEPDGNYLVLLTPQQQITSAVVGSIGIKSATGFQLYLSSLPGGNTLWAYFIVRI